MDQTKTSGGATRRKAAKPAAGKRAKRPLEGPLDPVRESMDLLDQGISVVDGDLGLVYANRKFIDLLGFPRELCVPGTPFAVFIRFNAERGEYGPGDVEEIVREHVERAKRREPHLFERTRPDGSVIEVRGTPLPGGGFVTTYTDITERKRAENELRESERQYRDVVEGGTALIVRYLPDSTVTFANTAYAMRRRTTPDELIGQKITDWKIGENMSDFLDLLASLSIESPVFTRDVRTRRADGTIGWQTWTSSAFFDGEGNGLYFQGVGVDITERKQAEEALRESEARFRGIFRQGPLGMAFVTLDFLIAGANDTFCEMTGYSEAELKKMSLREITHPDSLERDIGLMERLFHGELPFFQTEKRYIKKNKDIVEAGVTVSVIRDDAGDPLYLMSAFITPLTNNRTDEFGGSLENRLRYPLEVFAAVRAVWPTDKPMSVRVSSNDWAGDLGITPRDSVRIARAFKEAGVDIVDVSAGQTSADAPPVYGRMFQTPFSDQIRNEVGIPTMAVGNIYEVDHVNSILMAGRADLCCPARPHLSDPYWTLRAATEQSYGAVAWPKQYLSGKEQLARLAERARGMVNLV